MGVIKNLMVRIGADARGYVGGMKTAGSATQKASSTIQKHTTAMRKTVSGSFSASRLSLKQYTATIARTTQDYNEATQNADRLKDKIGQMKGIYELVKGATEGLDLSKPFEETRLEAEKALTQIEAKRRKLEATLASVSTTPKGSNSKRAASLQEELDALAVKSAFTVKRLEHLDRVAETIGDQNIGYASAAGLKQLEGQITATQNELNTMKILADQAKRKLHSMGSGVTAWQLIKAKIEEVKAAVRGIPAALSSIRTDPNEVIASGLIRLGNSIKQIPANLLGGVASGLNHISAGIRAIPEIPGRIWNGVKRIGSAALQAGAGGVRRLGSALLDLGGSAIGGIASLPAKLRNIGTSASGSCGGLGRMVRSIRNIGIASLGMRVAGGMFGRLRSIISSYIYQNEALNASITSMKNRLGEALLPAINMVMAAMQALMPVITAISSGINSIMTALFGNVVKTTSAIQAAGGAAKSLEIYGFDQITKATEESGGGSGSSGEANTEAKHSALVDKLTGWIQELKAAFVAGDWKRLGQTVGSGINGVFSYLGTLDIGSRFGSLVNNIVTTVHAAMEEIRFLDIGNMLGGMFTDAFRKVDWNRAGETVGMIFTALPKTIVGFIQGTDWSVVGTALSDCIKSTLGKITAFIKETDWLKLGESILSFISSIDWSGIVSGLVEGLGSIMGGFAALTWGLIKDAWGQVVSWWKETAFQDGKFTMEGLLKGIGEVFANIGNWIRKNIFDPFINGFRDAFKIHSPSVVMEEHGGFLISGLLNGIVVAWEKIKSFFSSALPALSSTISGAFAKVKTSISDIWKNGIVPAVKGPVNSIISIINSMVSGIVSGINSVVKALNKLSFDVPEWIPEIGGKTFGFNLKTISAPQIPMLARGGVVDGPTAVVIGEQGKEAVVPLEKNTQWIKQVADELRSSQTQSGGPSGSAIIQIFLGHRKITEYFIKDINQMTRENGVCPIRL